MRFFCALFFLSLCFQTYAQSPVPGISDVFPGSQSVPAAEQGNAHLPHDHCLLDMLRQQMSGRRSVMMMSEQEMDLTILERYGSRDSEDEIFYVPVVVHIIHNNGDENISDAQVAQAIIDMNDAFANTGIYSSSEGSDTGIRFCLASQDPDGLPTNGITRFVSPLTELYADGPQDEELKNIVRWDPLHYVNIWIVKEIQSYSMGGGVAGYAHLPNMHGTDVDGIVNEARWFGTTPDNSKVHIHEMGHYLGLYHTFEGGCSNNDCRMDGDHVCDTPPDASTGAAPCDSAPNTCTSDEDDTSDNNPFRPVALGGLGDQPDLLEDYMDYGMSECQKLFTPGQRDRMRNALQNIRGSLLESEACQNSCGMGNLAITGPAAIEVLAGEIFESHITYLASVGVSVEWIFQNNIISTDENLVHTFANEDLGSDYLYARLINEEDGTCFVKDSVWVTVRCNPSASFTFSPYIIDPGEPVTFDGHHPMATSYQWFLNGVQVGSESTYTHTFDEGGSRHIYLVTGNGVCFDTSATQYLGIGACGNGANNHWVIGGGRGTRLDFSGGGDPVVLPVPAVGENELGTIEGLASISDRNGNLLFYSDGVKLFNRNHEQFFYGMGAGSSSAQGVLIVPDPGNDNSFYVFTAENFGGISYTTFRGLSYLKVDMTMNGGLGGVSSQYYQLLSQCGEKLAATLHCNGTDIWVVAHGFNNNLFYSYLITAEGVQPPVVTAIGQSQYDGNNNVGNQGVGYHKFSPDGSRLFSSNPTISFSEIYDFDTSTGVMSNPLSFIGYYDIYSAEFSQDGTKLYFSRIYQKNIYFCDISAGNHQMMLSSITAIGQSSCATYMGALQMAPNGKIYIARYDNYLDVINNPQGTATTCGFQTEALHIPGGCRYGLNNILFPRQYNGPAITGPQNVCVGTTNVRYKTECGDNTWEYYGNNTMTLISNREVAFDFTATGVDTLICHRQNSCLGAGSDTLLIHVGGGFANLGNDTTVCAGTSLHLTPGTNFNVYQWNTGVYTSGIHVSQSGTYWVQVTGLGGCTDRDTINVSFFQSTFDVPDVPELNICGGPNVTQHQVFAETGDFTHIWNQTQSAGPSLLATLTGDITEIPITYYNLQGCADRDTITVRKINQFPPVNLGPDIQMCPDGVAVLTPQTDYPDPVFFWNDGSSGNQLTVYHPGQYWVRYRDSLCHQWHVDQIQVSQHQVHYLQLPQTTMRICEGSEYTLNVGSGFSTYTWQDGSTGQQYVVDQPGEYWVEAVSACQVVRDTVLFEFIDESLYDIGFADTLELCSGQLPYDLRPASQGLLNNLHWSTGASNSVNIFVTNPGTYWLTANFVCGEVTDTTHIIIKEQPLNVLPENTYFCEGETSFVLDGVNGAENVWSTGETTASITVTETGNYTLSATIENGCVTEDQVYVSFSDLYLNPIEDITLCEQQVVYVTPETNASSFASNALIEGDAIMISQSGQYVVVVFEDNCVKHSVFSVVIDDPSAYALTMPEDVALCKSEFPYVLSAESEFQADYMWNTGEETASIEVSESGWYRVVAEFGCGTITDSTFVETLPTPEVNFISDEISLCNGEEFALNASSMYDNLWSDGSTGDQLIISGPGEYWLQSTNEFNCYDRDTLIAVSVNLHLEPIDDFGFCEGEEVTVETDSNASGYHWNTGQTDPFLTVDTSGEYTVTAVLDGCELTESFTATEWPAPEFDLGPDIVIENGIAVIGVADNYVSYTWNDPSLAGNWVTVLQSGIYSLTVTDANGCTYTDTIEVTITTQVSETGTEPVFIPTLHSVSRGALIARYGNITVQDVQVYDAAGRRVNRNSVFPEILHNEDMAMGIYHVVIRYSSASAKDQVYTQKVLLVP